VGVVAAGVVGAAVLAKTVRDVQGSAAGDIDSFLDLPVDERTRRPVVAVIGASIVRGRASVALNFRWSYPTMQTGMTSRRQLSKRVAAKSGSHMGRPTLWSIGRR